MSEAQIPDVKTLRLDAHTAGALEVAARHLRRGELVVFPTDTVYAVAAHAFIPAAVAQLYVVKGRSGRVAIPLLLPDAAAIQAVCTRVPPHASRLAERFWPGGLSLVLHRASVVPDEVTAGGETVAVRVPDHSWVRELCRLLGAPLAATSANRHGHPSAVTPDEAWTALAGRVALIVDGGLCPGGVASTVLDLTVSPATIRRSGPVTAGELATIVPLGY